MSIIQLQYTAPVYVEVNTDTREIVRVVVDDENITLDPANDTDALDVTGSDLGADYPHPTSEQVKAAVAIASDADVEFPAWEFGY